MTSIKTLEPSELREFDREVLRSDFASLFWAAIDARKKRDKDYTMQRLADALGRDKSVVSKWFSGEPKNWEIDTIADIANALDLDLALRARERTTDQIFTPAGPEVKTSLRGTAEVKTLIPSATHLSRMTAAST